VARLVPDALAQGLLGFAFGCPDMIGGGSFVDFLPGAPSLDQDLFVRYAQTAALMPMMQYSAAPWRVLDADHARLCREAGDVHLHYADMIIALAKEAAVTGEPIIRYMEYVFPHEGFADVTDQFMIGDTVLCAPVTEQGAITRTVVLPRGSWRYCDGTVYEGGCTLTVPAPINVLPVFEKC
jgi:alpha-glucosidase (family GH31 glycosyl hydrolase)